MMAAWIRLARRWLRLPDKALHIPGANPARLEVWNPSEGYLRYRMLGFWLGAIPTLIIALVCFVGAPFPFLVEIPNAPPTIVLVLLAIAAVILGLFILGSIALNYAIVHLELDMLCYTLTDQAIRLRRGVVKVTEVTLSYANIQNVKYIQGPVQRYFGIGDLIVETAGGGAAPSPQQASLAGHHGLIKGVSEPETLRDHILTRVRRVKGAGLGDAADEDTVIDSAEGRTLLKEIRDTIAAIRPR